jgi:hypothetical protein
MSKIRQVYFTKLYARITILLASIILYFYAPGQFDVIEGWNFFKKFSVFHVLWGIWVYDMMSQLFPVKNIALGSQKFFKEKFRPAIHKLLDFDKLKEFIKNTNKAAGRVLAIWLLFIGAISALKAFKVIENKHLFLISVAFYVCDLICVLIWCPFRLMLGNKCCTTCRIFNWDHMMMFSPIVFVPGFFTWSLCAGALVVLAVWEISFALHPERFYEGTNDALKCSNCTDVLCGKRNCAADIPDFDNIKKGI